MADSKNEGNSHVSREPGQTAETAARKAAERQRLAAALRSNLKRRKAQVRARQSEPGQREDADD